MLLGLVRRMHVRESGFREAGECVFRKLVLGRRRDESEEVATTHLNSPLTTLKTSSSDTWIHAAAAISSGVAPASHRRWTSL